MSLSLIELSAPYFIKELMKSFLSISMSLERVSHSVSKFSSAFPNSLSIAISFSCVIEFGEESWPTFILTRPNNLTQMLLIELLTSEIFLISSFLWLGNSSISIPVSFLICGFGTLVVLELVLISIF
ncbi:unnamed protein product [Moneuplotes crassus]|uniref:Uncharacterized protein n=1 Tax=Euplotes crassus TaxID=5936 RepID=A0AAD2D7I5_EUPCR|nr:unnamed protein product [Moneuplotes crassus]